MQSDLLTPASSPSPDPIPATRKRQRSHSMQSESSSSSAKRSAADATPDIDPRSPHTDHIPPLPSDDDYMAHLNSPDPPLNFSISPPSLSPRDKFNALNSARARPMLIGDTWYLVSYIWWKRWKKACTGELDKEGPPVDEKDVGPVDNSDLLDAYNNLRIPLLEESDVVFIPEEHWSSLVAWYGPVSHPLPRRVIARGAEKQPHLEMYPPRFKVHRVQKAEDDGHFEGSSHPWVVASAGELMPDFCTKLADAVSPNNNLPHPPFRVWKLDSSFDQWGSIELPSSKIVHAETATIVEAESKTIDEYGLISEQAFAVEFKADSWLVEIPKPVDLAPKPIFSSENGFFNKMTTTYSTPKATTSYKSEGLFSTAKSSALTLVNKTLHNSKTLEPGTLGLGNMGNTCFMNSALQCLAHTKVLTEYFLNGVYQEELNPDNPLGMHGAIAEAFGDLLQRIWATSGPSTSYSPREFKSQLQRFAPQFSGYQQHDSQELVAFLLDGLHEDLNRVLKKPYVEKPDWEGGGDLELVQLAKKSWEGYMMRNDSVIVDLFQGQYQSTLVCPDCQKVSITFDPFMYLTLPIPVQKKWKHTIYYVPWDNEKPHVKVPVEINRDASFKDLRQLLGRWMGAPPENLLTLEIFSHRFYKNLDDSLPCGEMADNDVIVCFELPCHAQQNRAYKRQENDPMIVPVFLCDAKAPRNSYLNKSTSNFGYPTLVVITPEQAKDVDTMYAAVVSRLERWTDHARDLYTWEPTSSSSSSSSSSVIDEVPLRLNGFPITETDSITEFTEDGKIVDIKIDQEGDIVDEKRMIIDEEGLDPPPQSAAPQLVGAKKGIFNLRLQSNHKEYGTLSQYGSNNLWETWDTRREESDLHPGLLRSGDAFYCEFDENMKAYYFGDNVRGWEHARWDTWGQFIHPEYQEAKKGDEEKKNKGISLQDCLDEFTKEEKLGEDDLWYCPQCKKHQQATKRFDLWKAPDVLVVHLKRFSNSRTLRDKIDTFIDFPVEGLDLGHMIGERAAAKRLVEEGVDVQSLDIGNLDEPLVYDLFAVDEHMGGLGGGHYRAYAANHQTGKWYHFDDSYVTPAKASDAVNSNAYLLFYQRRSSSPLGGKTQEKIDEARLNLKSRSVEPSVTVDTQLPTPPNESESLYRSGMGLSRNMGSSSWNFRSDSNAGSSISSPPPDDPPSFDDSLSDPLVKSNDRYDQSYDFPDPSSNKASPSSSNEAEADLDLDLEDDTLWPNNDPYEEVTEVYPGGSPDPLSNIASPTYSPISSSVSDLNPFNDANVQKPGGGDTDMHVSEKNI